MDILIKNMEMPQEGHIEAYIWCNGTVTYRKKIDNQWDRNSTTAVALPEHGRLIDADELEGILDEVNGYGGASEITYKKMIEILHDETLAPVIVEANNE